MKQVILVLVVAVCAIFGVFAEEETRYDGMSVIRIAGPVSASQMAELERQSLDIWSRTSEYVDVMVSAIARTKYTQAGWNFTTLIEDVQSVIDEQAFERNWRAAKGVQASWDEEYHTFESIVEWSKQLATDHGSLVTYYPQIGTSVNGRSIVAVSLHGDPGNVARRADDVVPQIVIIAGQHAREWIAPATTMYVLQKLIDGYGTDPEVTTILNAVNITIVPIVNPDGYDYSWTTTRLWRKNRRANANGSYGVDLNRNWDDHWCEAGASKTPSSDTYCGTGPFSEPESRSVAELIKQIAGFNSNNTAVRLALDMHAYSQLILRPYGWTTRLPPNNALLASLGSNMASLIRGVHGKSYTNQAAIDLYPTTGSAEDWFYSAVNVPVTYTFELRDTGSYGFLLPPNQIVPSGQEIWAALEYLLHYVATSN